MNTKNNNKNVNSFTTKALKGTRAAVKQLIEERKKTNDFIIISENGKVKKVRARSLK